MNLRKLIDANEAILREREAQQDKESQEYQDMLDEIESTINIDEAIVNFNKIVESYGYDLHFTEWIAER